MVLAVFAPSGCHHDPSGAAGAAPGALRRSQDRIEVPAGSPLRLRVAPVAVKEVRQGPPGAAEEQRERTPVTPSAAMVGPTAGEARS